MRKKLFLAAMVNLFLVGAALGGLLVDGTGQVTAWGITPFSRPNQMDTFNGTLWMTLSNDYSPVQYPSGVGHVPSPGGSTGEAFDLEEMYVRIGQGQAQVLLVASSGPSLEAVGSTWYLGDLMIEAGGKPFAIVTQSGSQGLAAGAIYRINGQADVVSLQNRPRSYYGSTTVVANDYGPDATVPEIAGPWAVSGAIDASQLVGTAGIDTDSFSYGGDEDGTFLIQYTFDTSVFDLESPMELLTKITWGCGNDVIRVKGVESPHVPEPATIGMLLIGSILTMLARRREPKV